MLTCGLAWSAAVRAQTIEVDGADGCISERGLRGAIERYAARAAYDDALRARVHVAPSGVWFELLRGDDALAERRFESVPRRCAERERVVAIAIALAFESAQARERAAEPVPAADAVARSAPEASPTTAAAQPEAGAAREPAPEPEPEAAAPAPSASVAPEPASARVEPDPASTGGPAAMLLAGGGVLLGVLPEAAPVLGLGAGLRLGSSLHVELVALASPGVSSELGDGVVEAQLFGARTALCAALPLAVFRIGGCAGLAAAAIPARGRDFSVSDRATTTGWTAGVLAATLELALAGPVSARLDIGVLGSLIRPALEARVDGERRDATSHPIGSMLALHVLWRFGEGNRVDGR